MKKQFITEATRLQKLAGIITESQINENEEATQIVDFLNQHYDEAFNEIVKPSLDDQETTDYEGDDIAPEELGTNPQFHEGWFLSETPDFEGCAEFNIDSSYLAIGFMAQFEPFTDEQGLDVSDSHFKAINANPDMIAGKKVWVYQYDY